MNRLLALTLSAATLLAFAPVCAAAANARATPACKGRVVMADMTTKKYSLNLHWRVSHHKMAAMCEAGAKAKGYHLMAGVAKITVKPHAAATSAAAVAALPAVPAAAPEDITITASNWKFAPSAITLHAGRTTHLHLTSSSGVHGIQSADLGIPLTTILPGKTVTIAVTPSKPGTYVLHCAIMCGPGHATMAFTVTVL